MINKITKYFLCLLAINSFCCLANAIGYRPVTTTDGSFLSAPSFKSVNYRHRLRRIDGPPLYDIDVSHVKNPTPKYEPKSRYGNKPYVVHGTRYHVLPTSNGFRQRGIASWYGTRFHKALTSSGERYNMFAMTAAHKRLPLPTYLRVKNLENGREIIVKVNDRGPFASGRIIDLSYTAAKKLGMLHKGTARVEINAIPTPTRPKALPILGKQQRHATAAQMPKHTARSEQSNDVYSPSNLLQDRAAPEANFMALGTSTAWHALTRQDSSIYLRSGVFSKQAYAEILRKELQLLTPLPVYIAKSLYKGYTHYRVEIGPIHSAEQSKAIQSTIRKAKTARTFSRT